MSVVYEDNRGTLVYVCVHLYTYIVQYIHTHMFRSASGTYRAVHLLARAVHGYPLISSCAASRIRVPGRPYAVPGGGVHQFPLGRALGRVLAGGRRDLLAGAAVRTESRCETGAAGSSQHQQIGRGGQRK